MTDEKLSQRHEREDANSALTRLEHVAFHEGLRIGKLIAAISSRVSFARGYVHMQRGDSYLHESEKKDYETALGELRKMSRVEHIEPQFQEWLVNEIQRYEEFFASYQGLIPKE